MGIAVFSDGQLNDEIFPSGRYQMDCTTFGLGRKLEELFDEVSPTHVVCESYRIYSDRAKQHINSDVPTLRLIGRIEHICELRAIPVTFQLASEGKSFATDSLLAKWKISSDNEPHNIRHSKDAVRHGIHYLLFK